MIRICTLLLAVFVVISSAVAEDGWKNLFNGKNLKGWESKNGKAIYTVENGAIVGTTVPNEPNSFLCSKKAYGDFILEFEFFGSPTMNSGVMIRGLSTKEYKNFRVHGYQCELEDEGQDRDWSGGIYDEARRGWLFPMKGDAEWGKAFGEQSKSIWKDGEWNLIRVKCLGDSIQTWVNGQQRADLKDDMTAKGFIGLQVHGVGDRKETMQVKWRNIRIKKL
mgnify:CR=1 FL=1